MHGKLDLFVKSMKRVAVIKKNPRFPYALSEIRAYYHCSADKRRMTTLSGATELARIVGEDAKLTVVRSDPVFLGGGDDGGGYGYTLNCTLTESGVAFDCWPEYGTILQYLDLCNVQKDNGYKAELLWRHVAYYFGARWMYRVEPILIPIDPKEIDPACLIPIE